MSAIGTKRTSISTLNMSAIGRKADISDRLVAAVALYVLECRAHSQRASVGAHVGKKLCYQSLRIKEEKRSWAKRLPEESVLFVAIGRAPTLNN